MIDCIKRHQESKPLLFIIMGVSGSGKSTIAFELAKLNSFHFLEADDYHSATAKQKMQNGQALTDEDRRPWIKSMCITLETLAKSKIDCCLAYSGLRKDHRQEFRRLGYQVTFIHLSGTIEQLERNLKQRESHFFDSGLLSSQFDAMQAPEHESDIVTVDIKDSVDETVMLAQAIVLESMKTN